VTTDDSDAAMLPAWVKGPKQIMDGHLAALAKRHGARLATLDNGTPGAFVIPESAG
jgi:predicted nucleic acid-binding protein